MTTESRQEMQKLYFELGDLWAQRNQLAEAADAYALAMYYARRNNNQPLADLCREQVLACHPHHVAVREANAPLFFAQLLMRYPAEEMQATLGRLRQETPTSPSPAVAGPVVTSVDLPISVMAGTESAPMSSGVPPRAQATRPTAEPAHRAGTATMSSDAGRGGLASLFGPSQPSRAWSESISLPLAEPARAGSHPQRPMSSHSGFEQHHAFPVAPTSAVSRRAMDDFEMMPRPGVAPAPTPTAPRPESNGWAWLEPIAGAAAVAGALAVGFFAYKLWPEMQKIETRHVSAAIDDTMGHAVTWYAEYTTSDEPIGMGGTPTEPTEPIEKSTVPAAAEPLIADEGGPASLPRALPDLPLSAGESLPSGPTGPEWSAPPRMADQPPETQVR